MQDVLLEIKEVSTNEDDSIHGREDNEGETNEENDNATTEKLTIASQQQNEDKQDSDNANN